MNAKNNPAGQGEAKKTNVEGLSDTLNSNTQVAKKASYLVPGTALTAFLKRYRQDLLQLECSCKVSRLVDCCDCILDEVTP